MHAGRTWSEAGGLQRACRAATADVYLRPYICELADVRGLFTLCSPCNQLGVPPRLHFPRTCPASPRGWCVAPPSPGTWHMQPCTEDLAVTPSRTPTQVPAAPTCGPNQRHHRSPEPPQHSCNRCCHAPPTHSLTSCGGPLPRGYSHHRHHLCR